MQSKEGNPNRQFQLRRLTAEEFFEVVRFVSLGDALSYGVYGCLEFSLDPFREEVIAKHGDVMNVVLNPDEFPISDDSLTTHLTLLALLVTLQSEQASKTRFAPETFSRVFGHNFLGFCLGQSNSNDPVDRAWGNMIRTLWKRWQVERPSKEAEFHQVNPYEPRAGGNGGAMHAVPVGLLFNSLADPLQLEYLIATAVDSGRATHNHPTGFLGSVLVAFFTACALNSLPVATWPVMFVDEILPLTRSYLLRTNTYLPSYDEGFQFFGDQWEQFIGDLSLRNFNQAQLEEQFKDIDGPKAHDFLQKFAFGFPEDFWAGSSGHDVAMFAILALLTCKGSYRTFIDIACNHRGDSDTTGAVALPLYGLVFGTAQIPKNHTEPLERSSMLRELAQAAYPLFQNRTIP